MGTSQRAGSADVAREIRRVIADTRERLRAVVDADRPSTGYLEALRDELLAGAADPSAVEYPELLDPGAYWTASIAPRIRAVRRAARTMIADLEERIVAAMGDAEAGLKALVDESAAAPEASTRRGEVVDRVSDRLVRLHHLMAEVLDIVPDRGPLDEAKRWLDDQRLAAAMRDVDGLKSAYLAEAGGDDAHQLHAERQWSETYAQRVAHRDALLRAELPWRHQELAVVGHEQVLDAVAELVEETVARLQAPLGPMRDALVARFDDAVASRA